MPRYELSSPEGQTLTIEADSPPSESDIREIFKQRGTSRVPSNFPELAARSEAEAPFQPTELSPTTEFTTALARPVMAGISQIPKAISKATDVLEEPGRDVASMLSTALGSRIPPS